MDSGLSVCVPDQGRSVHGTHSDEWRGPMSTTLAHQASTWRELFSMPLRLSPSCSQDCLQVLYD